MSEQPPVAKIFEYKPGVINLDGFSPDISILSDIMKSLGSEILFKKHRVEGSRVVDISFPVEYIGERQDFFKRLDSSNGRITKTFFERNLPKIRDLRLSDEAFIYLCESVYEVLRRAKTSLRNFKYLPEAKEVLSRVNGFDSKLELMLERLDAIDDVRTFAIDSQKGVIVSLDRMPKKGRIKFRPKDDWGEWQSDLFSRIRLSMKKQAVKIVEEAGLDFREGVVRYIRRELRSIPNRKNLRSAFEQLALPVRLHSLYERFLESCDDFPRHFLYYLEEGEGREELKQVFQEEFGIDFCEMPNPFYPNFSNHYDIRGLFPLSLMDRHFIDEPFVPISFKSKPSEKKFLFAGLHSGGKTFFLENLVLLSILGQAGFDIPANSLTLPKFDRIFYYRNVDKGSKGGKMEKEFNRVSSLVQKVKEGDLLVIDEFLDSAKAEIANFLGPLILDKLVRTDATVFLTTHRGTNYEQLSKSGWTLMSPEYEIRDGKVKPKLTLRRGPPDLEINKRYALEKYEEIFDN